MRTVKGFLLVATVLSIAFVPLSVGTLSAKTNKPNLHQPVRATDVVLVPKMTLRGKQPRAVGGGQKKVVGAATGLLGELCTGARYAIVVGISNYPGVRNDLDYAAIDAGSVARALTDVYGFPPENIALLQDRAATRTNIMAAIDALRDVVGPEDEVVFSFSGHGMTGVADDGDAERTDEAMVIYNSRQLEPLWDGELREAFSGFHTSRIVFMFDSCMAGGMDDLQESGRVILMAAGENAYAYEGDEWGHGEFTYYLLDAIYGAANLYDYGAGVFGVTGQVTVEEAFDYAKANCVYDCPGIDDNFPDDLLP